MQLIDGDSLPDWLRIPKKKNDLPIILREVLEQCWRLDNIGLDHGELSHAPKHLIVDKHQNPWIVDFETASVNRKSANVTGVCQFLFTSNGAVARIVAEALGERNQENLLDALRAYKNNKKRDDFDRVLQACLS
jgi:putative serine/threonine protein kinase